MMNLRLLGVLCACLVILSTSANAVVTMGGEASDVPAPAVLGLLSIGLVGVIAATIRRNRKR